MDGAFQWVTVGTFEHSKLHIDTDLVIITIIITRLARRVVTSPGEKNYSHSIILDFARSYHYNFPT